MRGSGKPIASSWTKGTRWRPGCQIDWIDRSGWSGTGRIWTLGSSRNPKPRGRPLGSLMATPCWWWPPEPSPMPSAPRFPIVDFEPISWLEASLPPRKTPGPGSASEPSSSSSSSHASAASRPRWILISEPVTVLNLSRPSAGPGDGMASQSSAGTPSCDAPAWSRSAMASRSSEPGRDRRLNTGITTSNKKLLCVDISATEAVINAQGSARSPITATQVLNSPACPGIESPPPIPVLLSAMKRALLWEGEQAREARATRAVGKRPRQAHDVTAAQRLCCIPVETGGILEIGPAMPAR